MLAHAVATSSVAEAGWGLASGVSSGRMSKVGRIRGRLLGGGVAASLRVGIWVSLQPCVWLPCVLVARGVSCMGVGSETLQLSSRQLERLMVSKRTHATIAIA